MSRVYDTDKKGVSPEKLNMDKTIIFKFQWFLLIILEWEKNLP